MLLRNEMMRKFWRPLLLLLLAALVVPTVSASAATSTGSCATDGAVSDPEDNPGLVADCEALLAGRDTLAGTAMLNWSADVHIQDWEGIDIGGTPLRVVGLRLDKKELSGSIPPELGDLSNLVTLFLSQNELTGEIPPELSNLSNLITLRLDDNQLSGPIPAELGDLANLQMLGLDSNQLSGPIPSELGNLSNLIQLKLDRNRLNGRNTVGDRQAGCP